MNLHLLTTSLKKRKLSRRAIGTPPLLNKLDNKELTYKWLAISRVNLTGPSFLCKDFEKSVFCVWIGYAWP